jgi:predicted NBD/HSP70 family sugar kinase
MNDLTAAGHRYVDVGLRDFCILTVGSGIGHKVFLAGRPQVGEGGRGGEIGHLRVDFRPDALACDCGGRGHVGALASARGTIRMARAAAERDPMGFSQSSLSRLAHRDDAGAFNPTGEEIAFAFSASDAWASNVVRTAASYLGIALAAIHLDVGIERFVVIGGFALALGERYRQILVEAASAASWDVGQEWNRMIELGLPDDDHGMIGAGIVASDQGATR